MPEETTRSGPEAPEAVPPEPVPVEGEAVPPEAEAVPPEAADGERTSGTEASEGASGPGGTDVPIAGVRSPANSPARRTGRFVRELVIIVAIALIASALLRAFVVQAFYVPSGSMLPAIQLQDRILVSRIGDVERGEVVVFEDPGGWIPAGEQAQPPGAIHKAFEFVGILPASGHEHLVKRVIGLPGDHVVCCDGAGKLTINGTAVDESGFIAPATGRADNVSFDIVVPQGHMFVLGDNRYVSGDSSRHLTGQDAFVPMSLVTGRAFAVIWPFSHRRFLHIPSAYDDVPAGQTPPGEGVINPVKPDQGQ